MNEHGRPLLTAQETKMERCPNCGASVRTNARFCTACGFRLTVTDQPVPVAVEPKSSLDGEQWADADVAERMSTAGASSDEPATDRSRPLMADPATDDGEPSEVGERLGSTVDDQFGSHPASADDESKATDDGASAPTADDGVIDPETTIGSDEFAPVSTDDTSSDDATTAPEHSLTWLSSESAAESDSITDNPSPAESDVIILGDPSPDDTNDVVSVVSPRVHSWSDVSAPAVEAETDATDDPWSTSADESTGGPDDLDPARPDSSSPTDAMTDASDLDASLTATEPSTDAAETAAQSDSGWSSGLDQPEATNEYEAPPQDDVVLDTTSVETPSWEQDQNAWTTSGADPLSFETTSPETVPTGFEPASEGSTSGEPMSETGESLAVTGGIDSDSVTGSDNDWEPWGTSEDSGTSVADGSGPAEPQDEAHDTNAVLIGAGASTQPTEDGTPPYSEPARPSDPSGDTAPVERALSLLDELRAALAAIPVESPTAVVDTGAADHLSEANLILETVVDPLEADALDELERRATDLAGRESGVMALLAIAEQRQVIIDLITAYRQRGEIIDQLRSVLGQQ